MKKILVVGAHPDDETLGLGGTLALNAKKGNEICVLIFTDGESARGNKSKIKLRQNQAKKACSVLGIKQVKFLDYEDEKLDLVALAEMAKHIEKVIKDWNPSIIFTHYWDDINQDHRQVFEATRIAVRPQPKLKINHVLCYETPSSTEPHSAKPGFNPNLFVNIETTLTKKINAFKKYKDEVESFPHARSIDSLINRTKYWGSTIGVKNAEAFVSYRQITNFE